MKVNSLIINIVSNNKNKIQYLMFKYSKSTIQYIKFIKNFQLVTSGFYKILSDIKKCRSYYESFSRDIKHRDEKPKRKGHSLTTKALC